MNYHWNWGIFFEPNPMGTGTYLDMLLSGLALTLKTAALAWISLNRHEPVRALVLRDGAASPLGPSYAPISTRGGAALPVAERTT